MPLEPTPDRAAQRHQEARTASKQVIGALVLAVLAIIVPYALPNVASVLLLVCLIGSALVFAYAAGTNTEKSTR